MIFGVNRSNARSWCEYPHFKIIYNWTLSNISKVLILTNNGFSKQNLFALVKSYSLDRHYAQNVLIFMNVGK